MSGADPEPSRRTSRVRPLRLASGLVLLSYVTLHLFNHILGLGSLELAERGLRLSIALWQSWPGTVLLYGAFVVHFALALYTIYSRRHWHLPASEWLRLWSGFSLPALLVGHAVATRLGATLYDIESSYQGVIASLIARGAQGWQIALLAPGWVHGGMGLWLGLRHRPAMRRARPLLIGMLVAVPMLSAAGFLSMSREVEMRGVAVAIADSSRPAGGSSAVSSSVDADAVARAGAARARVETLSSWNRALLWSYFGLLGASFVAGRWREMRDRRRERLERVSPR